MNIITLLTAGFKAVQLWLKRVERQEIKEAGYNESTLDRLAEESKRKKEADDIRNTSEPDGDGKWLREEDYRD